MDSLDLEVLRSAVGWLEAGQRCQLVTVLKTWGSSPRPPGAMLLLGHDGRVVGSVSGGCIEDDLIAKVQQGEWPGAPHTLRYGVTAEEAHRFGLPCGGTLELLQEPLNDSALPALRELLAKLDEKALVARCVDLASGAISIEPATPGQAVQIEPNRVTTLHGPRWRLLVIGAGSLSRIVAQMAQALDYQVHVCDPREEYQQTWPLPGVLVEHAMPDDWIVAKAPDAHTAVVALTHDPKLDDLALMEALKSAAFYVGALGSRANNAKRRERLLEFDLTPAQLARLHGPIGLYIGSKTPPEIAVSILAEITAVKNGVNWPRQAALPTSGVESQVQCRA